MYCPTTQLPDGDTDLTPAGVWAGESDARAIAARGGWTAGGAARRWWHAARVPCHGCRGERRPLRIHARDLGSGAVLLRSLGAPTAAEVFIFAAGARAGFYLVGRLLGLLASATPGPANPINRHEDRVLAGAFDWIAVGAALGAVSLLDGIHGWLPWLVGPFAATVLYLLIASAQLAIVVVREK